MPNHTHAARAARRRATALRSSRAVEELRLYLESHGWLVLPVARERTPFILIALGSPRSAPLAPGWPPGLGWLGVAIAGPEQRQEFLAAETRAIAHAHGGRACFIDGAHDTVSW